MKCSVSQLFNTLELNIFYLYFLPLFIYLSKMSWNSWLLSACTGGRFFPKCFLPKCSFKIHKTVPCGKKCLIKTTQEYFLIAVRSICMFHSFMLKSIASFAWGLKEDFLIWASMRLFWPYERLLKNTSVNVAETTKGEKLG